MLFKLTKGTNVYKFQDIAREVLTSIELTQTTGLYAEEIIKNHSKRDVLDLFINIGVVDYNYHTGLLTISPFHIGKLKRYWN